MGYLERISPANNVCVFSFFPRLQEFLANSCLTVCHFPEITKVFVYVQNFPTFRLVFQCFHPQIFEAPDVAGKVEAAEGAFASLWQRLGLASEDTQLLDGFSNGKAY